MGETKREKQLAYYRKWKKDNREHVNAYLREYRQKNRDTYLAQKREYERKRREAKKAASGGRSPEDGKPNMTVLV